MDDRSEFGRRRRVGLVGAPVLFLIALAMPPPGGMSIEAWRTAAVGLLMAGWWITEAVPIAATALLPLAAFPVLSVASVKETAAPYANPVIFLFLGGFLIAESMQRWGLHRRIALGLLGVLGLRPRRMVAGFMLATAFLSMWVSNTATAMMMLPIAISVVALVQSEGSSAFALCLLLGIAYAASLGGMATLVGTPPNALLAGFLDETYGIRIGFARWMAIAVPFVAVLLPLTWIVLTRWVYPCGGEEIAGARELLAREAGKLGPLEPGEKWTALVFVSTAIAWIGRPLLENVVPGISDAGIAVAAGLLLFVLPAARDPRRFVLDARAFPRLPWDVLLLFGGGLSLAGAVQRSGLAGSIGGALSGVGTWPLLIVVLIVATALIFLTELTSNTASTATFLPIIASLAVGIGENPFYLVVPAALAASCAFMLPVATPPNAIIYGSGQVSVPQMARAGVTLNGVCMVALPLVTYVLIGWVLGAEPGVLPSWASPGG